MVLAIFDETELEKCGGIWYNQYITNVMRWNRLVAMTRDCKSLGFGLRRFESYFQHHENNSRFTWSYFLCSSILVGKCV